MHRLPVEADRVLGLNRTSVGLKPNTADIRAFREAGLNRTSVGLKRGGFLWLDYKARWAQSNQRGIETCATGSANVSVTNAQSNQRGIEIVSAIRGWGLWYRAQSNQRGIETGTLRRLFVMHRRSIEPAWD